MRYSKIQKILSIIMALFLLQSCTSVLLGLGATVLVTNAVQEKSIGNAIDDSLIWTKINSILIQNKLFLDIKVRVNEGRVLLTGTVPNTESTIKLVRLVWSCDGVKEVINEILVQTRQESILRSTWITAQIKTQLLIEHTSGYFNYTVVTIDDRVYLFGIARDAQELRRVINIASRFVGEESVISHVRIKTDNKPKIKSDDTEDSSTD